MSYRIVHHYNPGPRTGDALAACLDCGDSPTDDGFGPIHTPSQARVWTARYALTAGDEVEARRYITARALADVPDATVEFLRGPVRDRGPRSYWRATVRRTRATEEAR